MRLNKFLYLFSILGIVIIGVILIPIGGKPCEKPLFYSIGFIDPRHGIQEEEFKKMLQKAEDVWESEIGKNLFEYKENAKLKVNLIFDSRQKEILRIANEEQKLDAEQEQMQRMKKELDRLREGYNKKLSEYNNQINIWNNGPRTDKNEFDRLKKLKISLENERAALDQKIEKYNDFVRNYNIKINEFNEKASFEEKAGTTLREKEINIYVINGDESDIFLIAHELGHALGIEGHIDDKNSLMYYKLPENIKKISDKDKELIYNICNK